jgi:hypothetical protein
LQPVITSFGSNSRPFLLLQNTALLTRCFSYAIHLTAFHDNNKKPAVETAGGRHEKSLHNFRLTAMRSKTQVFL